MTQNSEHSHDERVRLKAYEIWLNEGRPEGRDDRHWEMARELVGQQDAEKLALIPVTAGDTVEPAVSFENQADVPGLTDLGEDIAGPSREAEGATNMPPAAPPKARKARAPAAAAPRSTAARTGSRSKTT